MPMRFARSLDTLPEVMQAISSYCTRSGATGSSAYAISFAVEEIFTNMVKYNPNGPEHIALSMDTKDGRLVVSLEDIQEQEFDPTKAPDPPFGADISTRKPGGLGLFLVRKMVDRVDFRREGGKSIITISHPLE